MGLEMNNTVKYLLKTIQSSEADLLENSTMGLIKNFTAELNETSNIGSIPKRITMDNAEWARNIAKLYNKNHQMDYHGITPDFNFYFVVSVLTLALVGVLLLIYSYFCVWVLKGNLDLPLPGGPEPKKYKVWWKNPCQGCLDHTRSRLKNLISGGRSGDTEMTDVSSETGPGLTTITSIAKTSTEEPKKRKSIFEKTPSICDGFKQFTQFQYDLHDEEPEEVVFDIYDLEKNS